MERFYLKNLNNVEGEEVYEDKISNGFAVFKNLNDGLGINRAWESVREISRFQPKGA
jgi:hypothetical protein